MCMNISKNVKPVKCVKEKMWAAQGLLQSLPFPERVWQKISMDFIEGLPKSFTKSVILVVVDRVNKYAHSISMKNPYTAASAYMENVYKLHGLPQTIVTEMWYS